MTAAAAAEGSPLPPPPSSNPPRAQAPPSSNPPRAQAPRCPADERAALRARAAAWCLRHREAWGLVMYALSMLFNTWMSAGAKVAEQNGVPTFQTVMVRSLVLLAVAAPEVAARRINPLTYTWRKHALMAARGALGFGAVALMFVAVTHMPFSTAIMLTFLSPLFVAFLAPPLLREPFNWAVLAAVPVCLGGVMMIAQPAFIWGAAAASAAAVSAIGISAAIGQALCSGASKVTIRMLASSDPLCVAMLSMAVYSTLLSAICLAAVPGQAPVMPPNGAAWGGMMGAAVCGYLTQITGTYALYLASAAPAVAMSYTGVVWGILTDIVLFHHYPNAWAIGGGVIICATTLALSLASAWLRKRREAKAKAAAAASEGGGCAAARGAGCDDVESGGKGAAQGSCGSAVAVVVHEGGCAADSDDAARTAAGSAQQRQRQQQQCADPQGAPVVVVFSDIDGTLVHYSKSQSAWGEVVAEGPGGEITWRAHDGSTHQLLQLPPGATGAVAVTTAETIARAEALRARGARLVLTTGARLAVLLARLPLLPRADAYVVENGGRVFWPADPAAGAKPLRLEDLDEDAAWRDGLAAAGPAADADALPPAHRPGALWDAYRSLEAAGWAVDGEGYTANFRVRVKAPRTAAELQAALASLPPSLQYSFNMKTADVHPAASGKAAAAAAVLERLGGCWGASLMLCDDDNDLGLASKVSRAFVPGLGAASPSMAAAVAAAPAGRFWVSAGGGTLGSEEMLLAAGQYVDELLARR